MYAIVWGLIGAAIGYVANETVFSAVVGGLCGVGFYVALGILILVLALKN